MNKTQTFILISKNNLSQPYKIPYLEIVGAKKGKTITFVAGIHGDEVNNQKIIFDLFNGIDSTQISGILRFFPIINIPGYVAKSRFFSDGVDLNHIMNGCGASKFPSTHYITELLPYLLKTDILIDLHSDRVGLTNSCFAYADISNKVIKQLSKKLTVNAVISHKPSSRTLRGVCASKNIPCITVETGDSLSFDEKLTRQVIKGFKNIILNKTSSFSPSFYSVSNWQIATEGGYTVLHVKPKDVIKKNQIIGCCYDTLGNVLKTYTSQKSGYVLVVAKNPVLEKGDKLIHIAQ